MFSFDDDLCPFNIDLFSFYTDLCSFDTDLRPFDNYFPSSYCYMKEINRDYNLTNAELCMLASNFVVFMNRDSTEFAARGVDAAAITAFQTLGNAFELFPTD